MCSTSLWVRLAHCSGVFAAVIGCLPLCQTISKTYTSGFANLPAALLGGLLREVGSADAQAPGGGQPHGAAPRQPAGSAPQPAAAHAHRRGQRSSAGDHRPHVAGRRPAAGLQPVQVGLQPSSSVLDSTLPDMLRLETMLTPEGSEESAADLACMQAAESHQDALRRSPSAGEACY